MISTSPQPSRRILIQRFDHVQFSSTNTQVLVGPIKVHPQPVLGSWEEHDLQIPWGRACRGWVGQKQVEMKSIYLLPLYCTTLPCPTPDLLHHQILLTLLDPKLMKGWDKNRMSQKMQSPKQVLGEFFLPSSNWPLQT